MEFRSRSRSRRRASISALTCFRRGLQAASFWTPRGAAPQALADLPPPDAVFIGGGLADPALLPALWQALRPGGRLVANVISTAGERALLEWHATHGGQLTRLAVSRAEPLGKPPGAHLGWRALAPVTQLACVKPG